MNGNGIIDFENGFKYTGEVKKGMMHGKGVLELKSL